MKLQDKYPYDSTLLGLNNIYYPIGEDSFYINLDCILATRKIITIGKEYIIFESPTETGIKMFDVTLVDCNYREHTIILIVRDFMSQGVLTLHKRIERPESDCKWVIIDINFFIDRMYRKTTQDYCGCTGTNQDKQPMSESNSKIKEDLLEFEF